MNWTILNQNQALISRLFHDPLLQATVLSVIKSGYDILIWTYESLDEIELGDGMYIRLTNRRVPSWCRVWKISWKNLEDEECLKNDLEKELNNANQRSK